MDKPSEIKILRLNSGEDVIADVTFGEDTTLLNEPMVIIINRVDNNSVMMMVPWLPMEVIRDNMAIINNREIVTMTDPKENVIEYYLNVFDGTISHQNSSEDLFGDDVDQISNEINEYYDDDISTMDGLLNSLQAANKKTLH